MLPMLEMLPPLPSRAILRRLQQRPGPFNDQFDIGEKEGNSRQIKGEIDGSNK